MPWFAEQPLSFVVLGSSAQPVAFELLLSMAEATAAPIFVRNCRFRVRLGSDVSLIRFELTDVSSLYSEFV